MCAIQSFSVLARLLTIWRYDCIVPFFKLRKSPSTGCQWMQPMIIVDAVKKLLIVCLVLFSAKWRSFLCRCWYTNLTNTASDCDDFYTDPNAITLYKNWVQTITSRVNSISGVTYGSDPTIFSWNLINEPRCDDPNQCTAADIQVCHIANWIPIFLPFLFEESWCAWAYILNSRAILPFPICSAIQIGL